MTLREKLIVLRDKAGITQMSLAHQLGVSRQAVTRWESGDTAPSMDKLKALAKIYDVSLDWLCSDADEMEGRDKQPTKKQKVGIVVVIIIFGMLLLGWLFYQKEKAARPMEDMTSKTIEPEESENTESFDFGW